MEEKLEIPERAVIFSPHLDDAVLSMGEFIHYMHSNGTEVQVVSVFTEGSDLHSQLTEKLLRQANFSTASEYFAERKAEDTRALQILGISKVINLDYTDAAWRKLGSEPLYPSTTLNVLHESDKELIKELATKFKELGQNSVVFAPLARGRHVDHVLVRDACVGLSPLYYSDFPYSDRFANEDEFIASHHLHVLQWRGGDKKQKEAAIRAYSTQMPALFPDNSIVLPQETYYSS